VTNAKHLDLLFDRERPDVVFHAAAHKHVTFMEQFPEEAVSVNILGTLNVLSSAARYGVERFVFISTDKAVNPTSVMGATKRVSELLVQDMAVRTGARYATVRFGNVLSSRGSVVPLFRRQLRAGGPLTVTDPDATRYFMTIPEAVQLVLQASVLAEPGGNTFVLDMGEPVRIAQLAQDLVELHGLEVGKDIEMEFVGLRPGEKLVEELYFAEEQPTATTHEAVRRIVRSDGTVPPGLRDAVAELAGLASRGDRDAIVGALKRVVPEYQPTLPTPLPDAAKPQSR
jgi:FlaA1/EpsC-like NDP-sugar epimerase